LGPPLAGGLFLFYNNGNVDLESYEQGAPMSKSKKLQLTLKPQYAKRLANLKERTGLTSYSEVLREAFLMYAAIIESAGPEGQLFIEKKDGSLIKIPM
jgi:hypothetical protein